MAIATIVQAGRTVPYTPSSAVSAGDVVVQAELVGVAPLDIAADELGSIMIEGVIDVPKGAGGSTAIPAGTVCYWDVAEQEAGADDESAANKLIGKSVLATVDADTTVRIRLNQ